MGIEGKVEEKDIMDMDFPDDSDICEPKDDDIVMIERPRYDKEREEIIQKVTTRKEYEEERKQIFSINLTKESLLQRIYFSIKNYFRS